MIRFDRVLLAAALLTAPAAPLAAQEGRPPAEAGARRQEGPRNPVAALLAQRAELKLNADQVRRLEAIQADLERQNAPLRQQLGNPANAAGV